MHEDLLGYLLGALEPHETDRVSQWLRDDPEARRQLAEIERSLKLLESAPLAHEAPPSDLIARTMANLPSGRPPSMAERSVNLVPQGLAPMRDSVELPKSRGQTWLDWVGGAAAAAAVLGLMLPAIAQGRFEARKIACQDQLRQFGTALTQFVIRNQQERLPSVSSSGPEAFAGVYAVRLNDAGLIDDPTIRWCPSLDFPSRQAAKLTNLLEIPSQNQLHQVSVDQLREIQHFVGGHYAYNLGVVDREVLTPPRYESRASFAVMSDAPPAGVSERRDLTRLISHGGRGVNVLYEDGSLRFIPVEKLDMMPDHPLLNHRGRAEAGVNIDDASLAPSWRAPFVHVKQR